MSGGPLSFESIQDGLTAHICASLGVDPATAEPDELRGINVMSEAALNYFASSFVGAPNSSGAIKALLWAVLSGVWDGQVEQQKINEFFSSVNVDMNRLFHAWNAMDQKDRTGPFTVVFVPGTLTDADINDVVQTLFTNQKLSNG